MSQLDCPDHHVLRLPIDVVEETAFDPEDEHLSIIGTSGQKVTKMGGLEGLNLTHLCLRSHLIEEMVRARAARSRFRLVFNFVHV